MKKLAFLLIAVSVLLYTPVVHSKAVADLTAFNAYMTFAEWMEYCLANGLELDFSEYSGTADQFFEDVVGITSSANDPFRALGKLFRTGSTTEELFYRDMYSKIYKEFTSPQYVVNDNKLRGSGYSFSAPAGYQDILNQLRSSGVSFDFNGSFLENLSKRLNISRQALAFSITSDTVADSPPLAVVSDDVRLIATYLNDVFLYDSTFNRGFYSLANWYNYTASWLVKPNNAFSIFDPTKSLVYYGSSSSGNIIGVPNKVILFYNTSTSSFTWYEYFNSSLIPLRKYSTYCNAKNGTKWQYLHIGSSSQFIQKEVQFGNSGTADRPMYTLYPELIVSPYINNNVDYLTYLNSLTGLVHNIELFWGEDLAHALPVLNYGNSNPWSVSNEAGLSIDVPSADGNSVPIDNIYVPTVDGSIDNDSSFSLDIAGLLQKIADAIDSKSKVTYQDIADTITDTETGTVAQTTTATIPVTATESLDVPIADVGESNLILPSFDSPMAQTFTGGMSVLALIVTAVQTALGPLTYVFWFGVILCIVALVVKRFLE